MVRVCITGCLHGELDRVYADIAQAEKYGRFKTDLVLCCGDFQAVRNPTDLTTMSVPPKYYAMEETLAPIPTLFVGGNHEASGYLQELPYGGWVAPNIWYMGYAGVVQFAGLRIAGLSGIYKQHDYPMCHYEHPPYNEASKRSVYHVRNLEVFRLGQISRPIDIVISHDWPRGVYHYGDCRKLIQKKPHFRQEINTDTLGSAPGEQLLCRLKPRYWFAAHLHCKFSALVQHYGDSRVTRYLALDKCLPRREYLQFLDIEPASNENTDIKLLESLNDTEPIIVSCAASKTLDRDQSADDCTRSVTDVDVNCSSSNCLYLDPEWLCILQSTNFLMSTNKVPCILPEKETTERCDFSPTEGEIRALYETFAGEFAVPDNFERTAPIYKSDETTNQTDLQSTNFSMKQQIFSNPQTELICVMLDVLNANAVWLGKHSCSLVELSAQMSAANQDEEDDDDDDDDDEEEEEEVDANGNNVEYDPLNATCPLPLSGDVKYEEKTIPDIRATSYNPEELLLDDTASEDDGEAGSVSL